MSDTNLRERAEKLALDCLGASYKYMLGVIEAALRSVRDEALAEGRKAGMEEACKAVCPFCADGELPNANLKYGKPAHVVGVTIVFCKAAPIRAKAEEVPGERNPDSRAGG